MIIDHDALARAAQAYLAAHRAASSAKPGPNAYEQRADAAASLQLIFLSEGGSATTRSSTQGDEASLFQWMAERADIGWNLPYDRVQVSFPLNAGFSCLADAVRKARDNDQALIG
ncbi:hypothetical protein LMG26857_03301 [Achromobacter anxifer]|uniref:hypothetical protein n=1 Tax=Achromobacter anxifer TaxID=1287737 RepID=UPI00155CE07A|nr:hypothetical protein [Achromobacter anxifer]CAB5514243.1 hypothetical protein LMG26857_03301 [Achromobacter anxifer]